MLASYITYITACLCLDNNNGRAQMGKWTIQCTEVGPTEHWYSSRCILLASCPCPLIYVAVEIFSHWWGEHNNTLHSQSCAATTTIFTTIPNTTWKEPCSCKLFPKNTDSGSIWHWRPLPANPTSQEIWILGPIQLSDSMNIIIILAPTPLPLISSFKNNWKL